MADSVWALALRSRSVRERYRALADVAGNSASPQLRSPRPPALCSQ
jgi:hypothetical protein